MSSCTSKTAFTLAKRRAHLIKSDRSDNQKRHSVYCFSFHRIQLSQAFLRVSKILAVWKLFDDAVVLLERLVLVATALVNLAKEKINSICLTKSGIQIQDLEQPVFHSLVQPRPAVIVTLRRLALVKVIPCDFETVSRLLLKLRITRRCKRPARAGTLRKNRDQGHEDHTHYMHTSPLSSAD